MYVCSDLSVICPDFGQVESDGRTDACRSKSLKGYYEFGM
jgi:hypothetical protein